MNEAVIQTYNFQERQNFDFQVCCIERSHLRKDEYMFKKKIIYVVLHKFE